MSPVVWRFRPSTWMVTAYLRIAPTAIRSRLAPMVMNLSVGRPARGSSPSSEIHLVRVAPAPVLARLERLDDRVPNAKRVGTRVPVGRGVAAADVPARQAEP